MSPRKLISTFPFLAVFVLFFVRQVSGQATPQQLVLASHGVAHYVIYYGHEENFIIAHAAQELGQWLEEVSGASFTVTTDETVSQPKIVVGRNNPLTQAIVDQMDFSAIEGDGFRILTRDDNVYIAGAIDRGTLYGVYHLLDIYFGVHWLSPDFTFVPSRDPLTMPRVNDLQNPSVLYREIFSGDTDDAYFRQHNRLNGNRGGTHRQYTDYPDEINTWSSDGPWDGPGFQEIVGEVYHSGGQIEVMNPAVRMQAAAYFIDKVGTDGPEPWYAFSQEDRGWDPDEDSLAFAQEHGGALSAPIVDMVTDVANRVREVYPEAHLSTLAYQWSFRPPTGMTVPDYVMIEVAPIEADFGHPYTDTLHNAPINDAINGWLAIAPSLAVWDYNTNFQNYLQPLPNMYAMFTNIQRFARVDSFKSYFGEGPYDTEGAEFADLRAWVAARLLWNPDQDYHALIDQFCDEYYGPDAAPFIKSYIALLHQSLRDTDDRISIKERITADYLNLDFILQADRLLAQADAVATGVYSKHVHEVRLGVDMTILLREHMYAAEAEKRGITWVHDPARRARFEQYAAEANVTDYAEGASLDDLLAAMDIPRVNPETPDIVSPGDEWIDYQDLDFSYCCGAQLVEDDLASDHGAMTLDNAEWAIGLPLDMLPPGKAWRLYAYVRAEVKPDADPDGVAFSMGLESDAWIQPTVAEMQDGLYHVFEFPEMPTTYQTGKRVWVSSNPDETERIYVDRIIAINASGGSAPHSLYLPLVTTFLPYHLGTGATGGGSPIPMKMWRVAGGGH